MNIFSFSDGKVESGPKGGREKGLFSRIPNLIAFFRRRQDALRRYITESRSLEAILQKTYDFIIGIHERGQSTWRRGECRPRRPHRGHRHGKAELNRARSPRY